MRDIERRLERLEAHFGEKDCICGGPGLFHVINEEGKTGPEIEAELEACRRICTCPVHGVQEAMIVQILSFTDPLADERKAYFGRTTADTYPEKPASYTTLPAGRVLPHRPVPE